MVLGLILSGLSLIVDIAYWTKWAASYTALRRHKNTHSRRFDLYDFEADNQPEKVGVLVPKEETVLESPCSEEHLEEAADEIFIYGVNSKSECVVLRISRACDERSEAWIYLKLGDGRRYQLQETSGYQRSFGDKCTMFSCGGLQMYFMSPMRRWRIVYCGMLREVGNDGKEKEAVFVKFSFLWIASSEVYDFTSDLGIKPTAEAMANAEWISSVPPIDRLTETFNFYSQSGVVNGTVSVEDQPDAEVYLFGERIRHIGKSSYVVGCKFKQVLGFVPESGLVVHLGRASVPNTFHNLPFGFIVHPNGSVITIEDGLIITRMSGSEDSSKNLTAMFKAGKQYELTGNFDREHFFSSEHGWNGYLELREIEFEINNLKGSGILISGEITSLPERKPRRIVPMLPSVKPLTVNFTDEISHFAELTGGKGSSLGKLTKLSNQLHSFIVPKGIVVTTAAYSEFLTSEIIKKIENLKNVTYGNIKGNKQDACKIVASAVESSHLPDRITTEIEEKLNALFGSKFNQYKFAVRSSATGEDTDQMSAAGQMDTFLGVQGLKEIFTAVKKCWASQFGYIAVEYKRQNGQILNSPMAVVIQQMVDCEAAGVLFTCDPVTNNPSVLVITGNYGLGESVVSGSEEPDTVVLHRLESGEVEMKSVTIGLKQHRIIVPGTKTSDAETTVTEDVPEDERNKCCISKKMAEQLGRISLKIEDYYKSPRDIEWGIVDDTIYIFQSRPVTTGVSLSDYEIKHEIDGPLRSEAEYFSRSNVGEVLPGATSHLGWDFFLKATGVVFFRKELARKQRNNFNKNKYFPVGVIPICNQPMLSVVDIISRADSESLEDQSIQIAIFGRLLDDPGIKQSAKHRESPPLKQSLTNIFLFFKTMFFSGYGIEDIKKKAFSYEFPIEKCRTSLDVFNKLMHTCTDHADAFTKHIICTEMSAFWNMNIFVILGKAKGGIDTEVYSDFSKLLSSSSNIDNAVESADVPDSMQDLAHCIVKEMKSEDFKALSVEAAKEWLETSTGVAGYKFRTFLKRHGHRCLKELDVYSLTWSEDMNTLIKLLQNMSGSCTEVNKKKEANVSTLLSELKVPLSLKSRMILRYVLPNSHRCVRERENCKSNLVKCWDNTRKGFQNLSKKMVSEGYIPDKELIFFMTIDEIKDLLHTRNPRLIARANQRRKIFPTLEGMRFPELMRGRPTPVNEEEEDEVEYVADLTMKGIPVSQGSVKGYARVAMSLEEASHLQPGEILITYSTDIGWSPYFPILAGVVTELGGLISHGAVVSREYGLPCVVGLHGATRKFVTGDYVLLDGNKGILQRLTSPDGQ